VQNLQGFSALSFRYPENSEFKKLLHTEVDAKRWSSGFSR